MRSAMAVNQMARPAAAQGQAALRLAEALDDRLAMRRFLGDEPARDALEARPPERPGAGPRQHRAEMAAPDRDQLGSDRQAGRADSGGRIRRAPRGCDAEIGAAGIGVERVERSQPQDMAGVDRVGVAQPGLDLGHRQLARPRGERRARRGWRRGSVFHRVEAVGSGRIFGSGRSAWSRPHARSTVSRRSSQRDGTVGTPSRRAARVSATSGAAIAWAKSCAAMPIARSGKGMPNSCRICRDIHGS